MKRTEKQIINCFKALRILTRGSTIKDLSVRLNVSGRTAYRYLELLKSIGFLFEERLDHFYKVTQTSHDHHLTLSFTEQQVDYILKRLPPKSPLIKAIRDKLYVHSDILTLPNKVMAADFGRNIRLLDRAIQDKKRVVLKGYSSAHTNRMEDYKVEPIQLDDNYQRLFAYDLLAGEVHQYKTERIGEVELLKEHQWFTEKYTDKIRTDCFGWMIEDKTWNITLDLSRMAYHIIKEEKPAIEKDTTEQPNNRFLLTTTVADLQPVTSMILRLPGEIRIIRPKELEVAAAERLQKLDFFEKYYTPVT